MFNINWNPAANAVNYEVVLTSPGFPDSVTTATGTSAQVNLPANRSYTVKVAGVNSAGVKGPESAPVEYTPPPVPDQVTGVTVQVV